MAEKMTNTMFAILCNLNSDTPVFVDPTMPAAKKLVRWGLAAWQGARMLITPAGRRALDEASHDR